MSIVKHIQYFAVAALLVLTGVVTAHAADKSAGAATSGEFDGANFRCLNYTNGLGENSSTKMQSTLARLWTEGYLAGFYKAQGKLAFSEDKADMDTLSALLLQRCRDYPNFTIMGVAMQTIGKDEHKIPAKSVTDFSPATYTCGQHVDARAGGPADTTRADLADMWAFAFIQGYKNATAPNMVIPMENKPVLVGIVTKHCGTNRDTSFGDMAAMIADKVKLQ
jgi:hypothetical protein